MLKIFCDFFWKLKKLHYLCGVVTFILLFLFVFCVFKGGIVHLR